MGMPQWTLCVRCWDAERPGLHSHAERGNDQFSEGEEICVMTSNKHKKRHLSCKRTPSPGRRL
ncbi:hypothetical protein EGJ55_13280 [Pseudomonas moraviensis]|nr:hypothetical protein EGJ55_13280 [Pseudomonas moraviensis]